MFLFMLGLFIICASSKFNPVVCCLAAVCLFCAYYVDKSVDALLIDSLKRQNEALKEHVKILDRADKRHYEG